MKQFLVVLSVVGLLSACGEKAVEQPAVTSAKASVATNAATVDKPVMEKATDKAMQLKKSASESVDKMASDTKASVESAAKTVESKLEQAKNKVAAMADTDLGPLQYKEGMHFETLALPVQTITPGKVEITEVFAYSCGHCYKFEPFIQPWKKTLPDYIEVVQSPAVWRKVMESHARILYTAKALGVFDAVHSATFDAIHLDRKKLVSIDEIVPLFTKVGIDEKKFRDTFNSFGVTSQVKQATARAKAMRIQGTPELVVDGRFRISTSFEGVKTQTTMLDVAKTLAMHVKKGTL